EDMLMIKEFSTVAECLEHYAEESPDALLVRHGLRQITYSQGADVSRRLARAMLAHGIERGDRIAVYSRPHSDVLLLFLAAASIGAVFVGINPKQTSAEIEHVFATAGPK